MCIRDRDGRLEVLQPESFDLSTGRVLARVAELGTFWVAVRPSAQPFALADFLPMDGDYYQYSQESFYLRETITDPGLPDPGLDAGPWRAWNLTVDPTFLLPNYPHSGVYIGLESDGSMRFGGSYSTGSGFLLGDWQWLAAEPLVVPAFVVEGEEFANLSGLDTFVPFGSGTVVPRAGTVRVRIGERHAWTLPVGSFADVVRVSFEVAFEGQEVWARELYLARGVGPIAIGTFGILNQLTAARARGREFGSGPR